MTPVLVLGGTFDPIHNAHLSTALGVAAQLDVEQVRLIPCGDPPHRPAPGASVQQRLHMLQAAVKDKPQFVIDTQELARTGPSYMVDTAANLRHELGGQVPICLMMGMDAFLGLSSWHRWQHLADYVHIVVMARPGWQMVREKMDAALVQWLAGRVVETVAQLLSKPSGYVLMTTVSQLNISATQIREKISAGQPIQGLLPEAVQRLIETEKLYRNKT